MKHFNDVLVETKMKFAMNSDNIAMVKDSLEDMYTQKVFWEEQFEKTNKQLGEACKIINTALNKIESLTNYAKAREGEYYQGQLTACELISGAMQEALESEEE